MRAGVGAAVAAMVVTGGLLAGCGGGSHSDPTASEVLPPASVGAGTSAPGSGASHAGAGAPASGPASASGEPSPGASGGYRDEGKQPARQPNQTPVLASLPGSSSGACVQVRGRGDVRSRSLAMGNFRSAQHSFTSQYGTTEAADLNLYVIPQHAGHATKVILTIAPERGGTAQRVVSRSVEQADQWTYFATRISIEAPGTYRITARAGSDTGCFITSFSA